MTEKNKWIEHTVSIGQYMAVSRNIFLIWQLLPSDYDLVGGVDNVN